MEAVCDNMDVLSLDVKIIDEYIESKKDIKKATKRIEIDLVARITKHMKDPKFVRLGEHLEDLREKHEQGLSINIEFLK